MIQAHLHRHDPRTLRLSLTDRGKALTHAELHAGLVHDAEVREALTRAIAGCPFDGVFFECAPVRRDPAERPWEAVIAASPAVAALPPDPAPFARHLADGAGTLGVRTFDNLGGDAVLVAPCRRDDDDAGAHLARFVRHAEPAQVHALWAAVGSAARRWLAERPHPLWVSTSGLGVSWLHVRLDERPKYITHGPYRRPPP